MQLLIFHIYIYIAQIFFCDYEIFVKIARKIIQKLPSIRNTCIWSNLGLELMRWGYKRLYIREWSHLFQVPNPLIWTVTKDLRKKFICFGVVPYYVISICMNVSWALNNFFCSVDFIGPLLFRWFKTRKWLIPRRRSFGIFWIGPIAQIRQSNLTDQIWPSELYWKSSNMDLWDFLYIFCLVCLRQ